MLHLCPACGSEVPLPASQAGGAVTCPRCRATSQIIGGFGQPAPPSQMAGSFPQPPAFSSPPYQPGYPPGGAFNPYQSPNPWADQYYGPAPFLPPDRNRALAKVKGPGIFLQIYGVLLGLAAVGSLILLPLMLMDSQEEEKVIILVIFSVLIVLGMGLGIFVFVAGMKLKSLKSYGLVMTCVILTFLFGFLTCLPAALVGIWPLVVLLDTEVKVWFDHPAPPDYLTPQ